MRRLVVVMLVSMIAIMLITPIVFAQEGENGSTTNVSFYGYYGMAILGCGLAIGLAAFGTGIGQGLGLSRACEGIARNPGASGKITTTMIIGLAFIESLCIYAFLMVLVVLFVKPFKP